MPGQRQRRHPQPRRQPLGPLNQAHQPRIRQLHSRCREQFARLRHGEPQIGLADLRQLAVQPQPVQPQPQVVPGCEDQAQIRRCALHQQLQLPQRIGAQLVHVIDDQPQPVRQRRQVAQQPLHNRPAAQVRRRCQRPHQHCARGCLAQRADHLQPEPLWILFPAIYSYPRGVPGQANLGDPRPHQHRLPAPSRRRHLDDSFRFDQPPKQRAARHDSSSDGRSGRNFWSSWLAGGPRDALYRPGAHREVAGPVTMDSGRSHLTRGHRACGQLTHAAAPGPAGRSALGIGWLVMFVPIWLGGKRTPPILRAHVAAVPWVN